MDRRNWIIVGAAVILGLLAVYLANAWFNGTQERQEKIAEQQRLVNIVVATRDLEFGAPLTRDNVRLASWPANSVPTGAYQNLPQLLAGGNVAIRPIAQGEPILLSRVSARAVLSANLPLDMRAVTVPVNDVTGVAGFVTPGDVVDVLLTRQIPGDGASGSDKMTSVVLENVQVLATDRESNEQNTDPNANKTATLQVDTIGAQKLALAREIGSLSLALRNVKNQTVGATGVVTSADLAGGRYYIRSRAPRQTTTTQQTVSTTIRQPSAPAVSAPRRPTGPTMSIFRGVQGSNQEVPRYGF